MINFNLKCERTFPILRKLIPNKTVIKIIPLKENAKTVYGLYEEHCGRFIVIRENDNISSTLTSFARIKNIELL